MDSTNRLPAKHRKVNKHKFEKTFKISQQEERSMVDLDSKASVTINGAQHEVNSANMVKIRQIGQGAHGTVDLMKHMETGTFMAVKQIAVNQNEQKMLEKEIEVLKKAQSSPHVVKFFGAWFQEGAVWICMEAMDMSLTNFYKTAYKKDNGIPDQFIGVVAVSVLNALDYLKRLEVIHRDVKPSNILVNRDADVKICDFGISGRLVDSRAKTQVGCSMYMAPERVDPEISKAEGYDIRSDVWSFGITLMELATGKYPYDEWKTPFQQIQQVVYGESPRLPDDRPEDFKDFINQCLQKDYNLRPKYTDLLQHQFVIRHENSLTAIRPYVVDIIDTAASSQNSL